MSTTSTPDHRPPAMTAAELISHLRTLDPTMPVRIVTSCAHDHHVSMYARYVQEVLPMGWAAVSDEPL